ncbi:hypothetical protein HDU67_007168, partial [Dinochytrium kinnereticum]
MDIDTLLNNRVWPKLRTQHRITVAIAGIPGSGKSTLAGKVRDRVNVLGGGVEDAVVVPMDGFHLTR